MYAENDARSGAEALNAERIYALLYKLASDVERLEALLRAMKKTIEEKKA